MNDAQKKYLEYTPAKKYSFSDWALLSDHSNVEVLESIWTRVVLKQLKGSLQQDKTDAYRRLSALSQEDRAISLSSIATDRKMRHDLRPLVAQQQVIVAQAQADLDKKEASLKRAFAESPLLKDASHSGGVAHSRTRTGTSKRSRRQSKVGISTTDDASRDEDLEQDSILVAANGKR
ncbi:hypothetical protein BGZ70_004045 [Mortierella alpina]|uniref:Uncharacterized protein n=1 Tax=Mortierella alpina TaxID=64518 RepID=A0A9P6IRD3_MORAP|nr:hypothetical protein BGZ70_004045 [Mortierella alpina]